jgi:hypothetical protein
MRIRNGMDPLILGSWTRIRIRIKVKIQELYRLKMELWRAEDAYNGGFVDQ